MIVRPDYGAEGDGDLLEVVQVFKFLKHFVIQIRLHIEPLHAAITKLNFTSNVKSSFALAAFTFVITEFVFELPHSLSSVASSRCVARRSASISRCQSGTGTSWGRAAVIPQRLNIIDLFIGRQSVEAWWRQW